MTTYRSRLITSQEYLGCMKSWPYHQQLFPTHGCFVRNEGQIEWSFSRSWRQRNKKRVSPWCPCFETLWVWYLTFASALKLCLMSTTSQALADQFLASLVSSVHEAVKRENRGGLFRKIKKFANPYIGVNKITIYFFCTIIT